MEKLNKVFKTSEIVKIDRYTIENEPVSSLELMERASAHWVDFFLRTVKDFQQVVVLAGSGNNGGDGYAIARMLKEKGWEVMVYRLHESSSMSEDCEINYQRFCALKGIVNEIECLSEFVIPKAAIVIDALFGSGLNRPVTGMAAGLIRKVNGAGVKVFAVDIPSGLMGEDNSNNIRENIIRADYTFTFQFPKLAFMLAENQDYTGDWSVLDIGLHPDIIDVLDTPYYYLTGKIIADLLPPVKKFAHKGTNGRGLLIAGHEGMMGAAILAAKSALRSGVGLLHCHVPAGMEKMMHIAVPEALISSDESVCCFSVLPDIEKYDAIAVGPGIGQEQLTVKALTDLLKRWKGMLILDADALNIIAEHKELLEYLHNRCILTPHMKEFERLAGKSANDFERLNKLSIFASRFHIHIVLKGAYSVIATPDGKLIFNTSGNPGMAKGGAGDVLTGVLLALAANRLNVTDLICIGVFAHGLAGDLMAERYGKRGICAGMIAEGMGEAWKKLE